MNQSELKLQVLLDVIEHALKSFNPTKRSKRQLHQTFKATHSKLSALNRAQNEFAGLRLLQEGIQPVTDAFDNLQTLQKQLTATTLQTGRLSEREQQLCVEVSATNTALADQHVQLALIAKQEERLAFTRARLQQVQSLASPSSPSAGANTIGLPNRVFGTANAPGKEIGPAQSQPALRQASQSDWQEQVLLPILSQKDITQLEQIKNTLEKMAAQPQTINVLSTFNIQCTQICQTAANATNANTNAKSPGAGNSGFYNPVDEKEAILSNNVKRLTSDLKQQATLYNKGLDSAIATTEYLNQWVAQHPKTSGALTDGAMATDAVLTAAKKWDALSEILSKFGIRLPKVAVMIEAIKGAFSNLGGKASKAFEAIKPAAGRILPWLSRNLSSLFEVIKSAGRIFMGLGNKTSKLGTIFRVASWVVRGIVAALAAIPGVVLAIIAAIVAVFLIWRYWDTIGPWLANLWQKIKQSAINTWNKIKEGLLNIWDTIKAGAINKWLQLKEQIKQKGLQLLETLTQFKSRCVGIGADWINSIGTGISKGFSLIKQILTDSVNTAIDWVKNALNWETLAPKFAALWDMLKEGAASKWKEIKEQINGQWLQLIETLMQFKDKCLEIGADWIRSLGDGILEGFNSIKKILSNSVNAAISLVKETLHLPETSPSPALAFAGADMPTIEKNPKPVNIKETRSAAPVNGDTINITIPGTPGMDATAIAQAVRAELEKRERDKAARLGSRFSD